MKISAIFICFIFLVTSSFAQDKIIMMNGKILEGTDIKIDTDELRYKEMKGNKPKERILEKYRVFAIEKNGKEDVIYKYDTLEGNFYTEDEMRLFVYGQQDAWAGSKPAWTGIVGAAVSGSTAYFLAREGNFIVVLVPIVSYLGLAILSRPKINKSSVRNKDYLGEGAYVDGYTRIAASKKNKNALWGSIGGFLVGFTAGLGANDFKLD